MVAFKPEKKEKKRDKKRKLKEGQKAGFWDKAEHDLLVEGVNLFGTDWKKVAAHVGTRNKI